MEEHNPHWGNVEESSLTSPNCSDGADYEYVGTSSSQFCDLMAHMMAGTTGQHQPEDHATENTTGSPETIGNNYTIEQFQSPGHLRCIIRKVVEEPDSESGNTVQEKTRDQVTGDQGDSDEEEVNETESKNSESQDTSLASNQTAHHPGPSEQGKTVVEPDTDLTQYSLSYRGNQLFICDHCSLIFVKESDLANHLATHPDKSPVVKQPCKRKPYRGKYANRQTVVLTQTGEKQFICKECGYSTNNNLKLTAHRKTHTPQKPYKCGQCSYSSVKKKTMDKHLLKHMPKSPLSCKDSDFTTLDKTDLAKHMETHSELLGKPYKCDQCHYSSAKKKTVEIHKRIKHYKKTSTPSVKEASRATTLDKSSDEEEPEHFTEATDSSLETEKPGLKTDMVQPFEETPSASEDCLPAMLESSSDDEHVNALPDFEPAEESDKDEEQEKGEEVNKDEESDSSAKEQSQGDEDVDQDDPDWTLSGDDDNDDDDSSGKDSKKKLAAPSKSPQTPRVKRFKCKECDYATAHRSDLRQHNFRHNGKYPFVCTYKDCGFKTGKRNAMAKHTRIHTGEKPFKCNLCDYATTGSNTLRVHMATHTGDKPHKCNQCNYSTTSSNALRVHIARHSGEKPFMCDVCGKRVVSKANLNAHMRQHTGEKPPKSFKCEECGYETPYKTHMSVHMARYHTGEKPYMCEYCGYRTVCRSNLSTHKKTHTGDKPFKCDLCDYRTVERRKLAQHKARHTGEKWLACSMCDFRTVYRPSLLTHMKIHTGEKPFKCAHCDYRTSRNSSLKSHMVSHTGDKPHVCPDCGHRTAHRCNLLSHMRKIHKKDNPGAQPAKFPDIMALLIPPDSGDQNL